MAFLQGILFKLLVWGLEKIGVAIQKEIARKKKEAQQNAADEIARQRLAEAVTKAEKIERAKDILRGL